MDKKNKSENKNLDTHILLNVMIRQCIVSVLVYGPMLYLLKILSPQVWTEITSTSGMYASALILGVTGGMRMFALYRKFTIQYFSLFVGFGYGLGAGIIFGILSNLQAGLIVGGITSIIAGFGGELLCSFFPTTKKEEK